MNSPHSGFGNVVCRLLLQKGPHLLKFAPSGTGIVKQIAELTWVWFDFSNALLKPGVALQDEDLVLRPAGLAHCMHWSGEEWSVGDVEKRVCIGLVRGITTYAHVMVGVSVF